MNKTLEEEFIEPKVKEAIFSMKKGKILEPDGFIVEVFLDFYDILKEGWSGGMLPSSFIVSLSSYD